MNRKDYQRYSRLPGDESFKHDDGGQVEDGSSATTTDKLKIWKIISLVLLFINLLLTSWVVHSSWPTRAPHRFPGVLHGKAPTSRIYTHTSPWSSHDGSNPTDLALRWNSMIDDHGIVAVDHKWAKKHHLPPARDLPSNPSKGMYLIDGYHSLHCLRLLRKAFYQALNDSDTNPLDKTLTHYSHCFDHLKQSITCSSTDNLFAIHYNTSTRSTGDWDNVQCKDWGALREWATEHSPCDNHDPKNSHFPHNICHGEDDRIPLADQWIMDSDIPDWAKNRQYEHQPSV